VSVKVRVTASEFEGDGESDSVSERGSKIPSESESVCKRD
jgi:hypothetical protein